MISAIIFDFNGVLVDDEAVHFELFREVLAGEGIALSERAYQAEYLGYDDRGCFEVALERAGQSNTKGRVDDLIARKASRYAALAETGLRFFPGAAEAVSALADRWPLAICSGALRGEIEFALARLGVSDRVEAIISAEDTQRCKPDPEGYLLALEALRSVVGDDLQAGQCLVVEDSLAGVQSAKAAGMWALAVAHTYPADQLRAAGADAVLERLDALDPTRVVRFFNPKVTS
ncbi:MAG: HAD family phosphatase [Isosphaeraceae bacterium]